MWTLHLLSPECGSTGEQALTNVSHISRACDQVLSFVGTQGLSNKWREGGREGERAGGAEGGRMSQQ